MTYIVNLIKCLPNCDTKLRPNFDTGGVDVWSNFRPNFDPPVSKFGLIDDDRNNQTQVYFLNKIVHYFEQNWSEQ